MLSIGLILELTIFCLGVIAGVIGLYVLKIFGGSVFKKGFSAIFFASIVFMAHDFLRLVRFLNPRRFFVLGFSLLFVDELLEIIFLILFIYGLYHIYKIWKLRL